jgi:hypothetical protein
MTFSPLKANPVNRAARRSLARRGGAVGAGGVLIAGTAAALLTALAGQAGAAATITVDSNGDGTADSAHCTDGTAGNCTLRDAAALSIDGDTITFDAAISSITLTDGTIFLGGVNITGPGSSALTITTTEAAGSYDVFDFIASGDVTVSGLAITKNRIWAVNDGNFTMNDVSVSDSSALYGGALYTVNSGTLVISNSHFENNSSYFGKGGAIYAKNPGGVTISDSEIINNNSGQSNGQGGGIYVNSSSLTMSNSQVTGNVAGSGGGLTVLTNGAVMITDSEISSNSTGFSGAGALIGIADAQSPADAVTIERTTIDGNVISGVGDGGGLKINNRSLVVSNSTISNNVSGNTGGGIAINRGLKVTINNSTITGNEAGNWGGGLYASSMPVELNQSTIAGNSAYAGGGVAFYFSSLSLSGTIVSANSATSGGDIGALYGDAINSDHSIVGTVADLGTGSISVTDLGGTIFSTTPSLLALADNSGPTKTMALDPTSVAIDAGPDPVATFTGNGFDQRGTPYLRVFNGTVDIGAFELQDAPTPTSTTSTTTAPPTSTTAPTTSTSTSTTSVAPDLATTVGVDPVVPEFTG